MANPATKLNLPGSDVRIRIGSDVEIRTLVDTSGHVIVHGVPLYAIGDATLTGLFSGQRKKDVLAFIPGARSNSRIELRQSKTGALVSIPSPPRLIERIDAGFARRARAGYRVMAGNIIINERTGRPYNGGTFAWHFALVRAVAVEGIIDEEGTRLLREQHAREGRNTELPTAWIVPPCPSLADFTFPDLRDTAVTWYARAGATVPEIAAITGHTLRSIYDILRHYLALDAHLADNAVAKLVDYMEREKLVV